MPDLRRDLSPTKAATIAALATLSNEERLAYFNQAAGGLETDEIKLSGIFSSGTNIIAQINTRSEHTQYFKTSDAQVSMVLSHAAPEVGSDRRAIRPEKADLDPAALQRDLAFLLERYQHDTPQQTPAGQV